MTYMCTDRIYSTLQVKQQCEPSLKLERELLDEKWGGGDMIQTNVLGEGVPKSSPRRAEDKMGCVCDTVQGSEVT